MHSGRIMRENFKSVFGERIVGAKTKDERLKAEKNINDDFIEGREILPNELSKSRGDEAIIEQANKSVDYLIRLSGGVPEPLELERIHLFKPGGVYGLTEGGSDEAIYFPSRHFIAIDWTSSDVANLINLQHELLHKEGKKGVAIEKGKERDVVIRHSGAAIYRMENGKIIAYLRKLVEGSISLMNRSIFENDIKRNPLYRNELNRVKKIKPWIRRVLEKRGDDKSQVKKFLSDIYTVIGAENLLKFLESEKSDKEKLDYIRTIIERHENESWKEKRERLGRLEKEESELFMAERTKESEAVEQLCLDILSKSEGKFRNKFDVLSRIAEAHFTGNLSPLRKMVNEFLGEGSWEEKMKQFSE